MEEYKSKVAESARKIAGPIMILGCVIGGLSLLSGLKYAASGGIQFDAGVILFGLGCILIFLGITLNKILLVLAELCDEAVRIRVNSEGNVPKPIQAESDSSVK